MPTFYYHAHFAEMLGFVRTHYEHVLRPEDGAFIDTFGGLGRNAQCLYVRMVNRKGRLFVAAKLRYPELGPADPLLDELRSAGLVRAPTPAHYGELLTVLTCADIRRGARATTSIPAGLRKPDLVRFVREHVPAERFLDSMPPSACVLQRGADSVRYLLYLFFGRIQRGTSQFTMRDLGLVRMHDFQETYEPRFSEREEALEHYHFATRLEGLDTADAADIDALLDELPWPEPMFAGSARLRDRLAQRVGRALEQRGRCDDALTVYARGESLTCVERQVRILFAQGRRDAARELLEICLDAPRSDAEFLFARDVYARKFGRKRTSDLTDVLRTADEIELDDSMRGSPERAAVAWFTARGARAFRVENAIWRTLFGLTFWDELFVTGDAGLHSPFDGLPATLADGTFHRVCAAAVGEKLACMEDRARYRRLLLKTSTRHYGTQNGVFRWRRDVLDAVFALVEAADGKALAAILAGFCRHYRQSRYGYPDLLVIDDAGARFVEVKTAGDQLRRNQLLRLEQLRAAGFAAGVLRIRWILDPAQVYVVVDVETTGGRGDSHRITEIGAVKVQHGRVVDRFQTLVNPQRSIPANITRLTGISNEMVAGAPLFADVADELAGFLDGAIFAAHNVEFDYGFIGREFRRVGMPFRMPKLCTCASMRRLYPGHRSYSLAALTAQYGISLGNHHRALCDAEAAAELLLLINERRALELRD